MRAAARVGRLVFDAGSRTAAEALRHPVSWQERGEKLGLGAGTKKGGQWPPIFDLERAKRFELSTLTLARLCSTPELRPHSVGAD